jgi:uncharacterized protein (DUF952 family)
MPAIWHVTTDGEPDRPGPEGFVHASFTEQLAGTLAAHFPDADRLVLLRLDPDSLGDRLRLESSRDGELFPHLYGIIEPGAVLERRELSRGPAGRFDLSALPG